MTNNVNAPKKSPNDLLKATTRSFYLIPLCGTPLPARRCHCAPFASRETLEIFAAQAERGMSHSAAGEYVKNGPGLFRRWFAFVRAAVWDKPRS
jgi:hypothetical protein